LWLDHKPGRTLGGVTVRRTAHARAARALRESPSAGAAAPATVRRLERGTGLLANAAITRMEESLPWYRAMPADSRSWVNLVAQAGIAAFVDWFRRPDAPLAISADVFGTAPRELTRMVTLQQTVELVRTTIAVVEERIEELAEPGEEAALREAVLRYSREIAFAAAQVYAEAAEARGAWDARLEALVVDALLRGDADEGIRSRAAALGWATHTAVAVVVGSAPDADPDLVVDGIGRAARAARLDVLTGVQGDQLVTILGGAEDPVPAVRHLLGHFAPGPVVVGPVVGDLLAAKGSAAAALAGLRAAPAWPDAPRPVRADALLPERVLAGDPVARSRLVEDVYRPLLLSGSPLLETLSAYLEQAASLEAAARMLFVHPNTVRYRLRRVTEVTGYAPSDSRQALVLRVALAVGRLDCPTGDL
jgi:DNA-binding PucR family transcriptional regulator